MGILHQLLNFYDAPASASFTLPPAEAIAYFKAKGLKTTFDWRDMLGAEHANAFTVAKMADIDMLADVQASLDDAIAQGLSFQTWSDTITPLLQSKGWWGRQAVTDPLTGETIIAQLGSPGRLKTIFRTNVQGAYAAGAWQQIQAQKDVAPFLLYDAVDDHRVRPEHKAWDGTVLPVDDDWWNSHYPPNGWNCRCGTIQLSEDDLDDLGLSASAKAPGGGTYDWTNPRTGKAEKVPKGLDPGWNANPGSTHLATLQKLAAEKIKAMAPKSAAAAAKGMKAAGLQAAELADAAGITVAPVIDGTVAQLAKGAGKAQIRQAQTAIADALSKNTPYLAKALQKLQGSKAGAAMDPVELLAKAKGEANKVKDAAALANWKQAQLAGKPGAPAGKAVFDSLPEPAQASILAEIEAKNGAAAAAKAIDDELTAIAAGQQGPVAASNLGKVKAAAPDATPAEILAKVKNMPATLTAGQQAGGVAGWLKNAIAGKPPTPQQQLAFDTLTAKQQAYQLGKVDAAKAAKNAPPVETELEVGQAASAQEIKENPDWIDAAYKKWLKKYGIAEGSDSFDEFIDDVLPDIGADYVTLPKAKAIPPGPDPISDAVPDINPTQLVQIGPQRGSNRGGTYVDQATGTEWYLKFPNSPDMARNEVLAAKLYQAAGIDTPDMRLITVNGETAVASRIEAGLVKGTPAQLAKGGAFDGFGADAWLANWDVAGATMDNLLMRGARAFRVDTGGALRYRAQGGLKGSAWGDTVPEIQSLRNAGTAPQAAKVFGKMTDADIEASVARVLAIDDDTISRLVDDFGPTDAIDRDALKATLKARRDELARMYPNAKPESATPPDAPDTARVTAREQADVVASRVNGFTFRTDSDTIEDQSVIVSQVTSAAGKPVTRLFLKVRGNGVTAIESKMTGPAATPEGVDLESTRSTLLGMVKSINFRAGKPLSAADVSSIKQKWVAVDQEVERAIDKINAGEIDKAAGRKAVQFLEQMRADLEEHIQPLYMVKPAETIGAFRQVDLGRDLPNIARKAPKETKAADRLAWQRKSGAVKYDLATFDRSNARMTGQQEQLPAVGEHATLAGDGYRVTYITDSGRNSISSRGVVMIDIDGGGALATGKGFEILEKIGVKATRSSQSDRLELYLDRIAYIRTIRNSKLQTAYDATGKIADPAARAQAKLKLLNADAGRDMTKSRYWNPEGETQAFGHGRVLLNRPDLDDAEVAAFAKDYVIYHNPTGLGQSARAGMWDRLKAIIEGGGQMGSQVDRMRRGVRSAGSSVDSDHQSGGANYIFTRLLTRKANGAGVYWNPERLLRRSDAFTYTGDKFGRVDRSLQEQDRQIDPAGWRKAARSGGNETNFRDSLSLFDDLERIVFPSKAEYDRAIGDMRAMGYRTWPDGRALDVVFSYEGKP